MRNVPGRFGFSIIEIMVVIGIISILASVLYVNFSDARQGSRDRALMTEIRDMQLALELYKEQNGAYPLPNTAGTCGSAGFTVHQSADSTCPGNYITDIVPDFITALPTNAASPNSACDITYKTEPSGAWYKLTAVECASDSTVMTQSSEMARCSTSCVLSSICNPTHSEFASSFAIYSFGGECQ